MQRTCCEEATFMDLTVPVDKSDHIEGALNARITLVEYGDYECPYCAMAYPVVQALRKKYGDRLAFVYRNFPLVEMHEHAMHAAQAAELAGAQDRFWPMHDEISTHARALSDDDLTGYAKELGVTGNLREVFSAGTYVEEIQAQRRGGEASGVQGTPSFFINGALYDNEVSLAALSAAIDAALG
jgi:protein-disulfide isomerase